MTSLTDLHDHQARRPTATGAATGAGAGTGTSAGTGAGTAAGARTGAAAGTGAVRQRGRAATGTARERELEREIRHRRQYVCDASRQLRNPLTGLRTELEEARLHPDQTDLADLIARTLENLDRLDAIVTDLHLLSRAHPALPDTRPTGPAAASGTQSTHRTGPTVTRLHLPPQLIGDALPTHLHTPHISEPRATGLGCALTRDDTFTSGSTRFTVRLRLTGAPPADTTG